MKKEELKKAPRKKKKARGAMKGTAKKGADLFEKVVALTGIPADSIGRELKAILDRKNIDVNHMTIDQLRTVVASYLREIMGGILDKPQPRKPEIPH